MLRSRSSSICFTARVVRIRVQTGFNRLLEYEDMVRSRLRNLMVKSRPDRSAGQVHQERLCHYKGVTFYKRTGKWEAILWYEGTQHSLGAWFSALEAARVYDEAIRFLRPSASTKRLNFHASDHVENLNNLKMEENEFINYREEVRRKSKEAKCPYINKSYKKIIIDQNGKWEVKYKLKTKVNSKCRYVLVGWYDTEETALRAYNEVALEFDGPTAVITSFHTKQPDIARAKSVKKTTSRRSAPKKKPISKKVVTNLTSERGDEPRNADSGPKCNFVNGTPEPDPVRLELPPGPMESEPLELVMVDSTYAGVPTDCGDLFPLKLPLEMVHLEDSSCHHGPPPQHVQLMSNQSGAYLVPYERLDYSTHPPYHDLEQEADIDVMHCDWHVVKPVASCQHLSLVTYGDIFSISTATVKDLSHLKMIPPFDIGLSLSM